MAVLAASPHLQFLDSDGNPLAAGLVYTYEAGTTTPKATYTDEGALTENTNPVVLDSAGRPQPGGSIWINGSYKFVVKDSVGNTITTTDNVTSFTATADAADPYFESFSGDGTETVFTLSQDFGTEEKNIMVFVNDEAGDVGFDIQPPTAYTLNGTSLTFVSAPESGTNNIQVWAPSQLVGEAAASAESASASATSASNSAGTASTDAATASAAAIAAEAARVAAEAVVSNVDFTLEDAVLAAQMFG